MFFGVRAGRFDGAPARSASIFRHLTILFHSRLGRRGGLLAATTVPCHFAGDEPLGAAQGHRRQRSQLTLKPASGAGFRCHLTHKGVRTRPLHPPIGCARQGGDRLRSIEAEEVLPCRVPAALLVAGGGAQGCMVILVLPVPWCVYSQAAADCLASP